MNESKESYSEDGNQSRRQRLLAEFFRNALALAMVKQAVVAGYAGAAQTPDQVAKANTEKVPPYLQG